MKDDVLHEEEKNRRNGYIISFILHAALFLLFFIPFLTMVSFPPEESGIIVVFGEENAGREVNPENSPDEARPVTQTSVSTPARKEVVTQTRVEDYDVTAIEKNKKNTKTNSEAEDRKKAEREKAEREQKEREAKEKEAAEKKKRISDLFGGGSGSSQSGGNSGSPAGENNGKVLDGITKGSGRVGGGLSSRGLLHEPSFQDNSQRSGRVVLTICVDKNGKVISSKFTQRGSTTSDPYLIQITEKTASRYKFTVSDIDSQCGTITVDYKVQ